MLLLVFFSFTFLKGEWLNYPLLIAQNTPKLVFKGAENIKTGAGVKSVILSTDGSKVYSMNLEGMSVYEFDRSTRAILRKLIFVKHPGRGFNYKTKRWINSYQEKPVEAHLTHGGRYLWISLHNAGGVVVWDVQAPSNESSTYVEGKPFKTAYVYDYCKNSTSPSKYRVKLLMIKTGTTPKVITSSPDGRFLFVANWHSNSVSVIDISSDEPSGWHKICDIKTGPIPRGLLVSDDSKTLFVAQMGSSYISVYTIPEGNSTSVGSRDFKLIKKIPVGVNPRHIVSDGNYLYVSLNVAAMVAKISLKDMKLIDARATGRTPRTIELSGDKKYLFVTCYYGNCVNVFKVPEMKRVSTFRSALHPVGVAVYQIKGYIEAWVANYTSGTIKILKFYEETPQVNQPSARTEAGNQTSKEAN